MDNFTSSVRRKSKLCASDKVPQDAQFVTHVACNQDKNSPGIDTVSVDFSVTILYAADLPLC